MKVTAASGWKGWKSEVLFQTHKSVCLGPGGVIEKKFTKACCGQMASLSSRLILKLQQMFINDHLITQSPSRWDEPGVYHIKQNK